MSKIKTCRNNFYLIAFFFLTSNLYSQKCILSRMNDNKWVDSVFNGMTLEERIGQLIMIRGSSSNGHYDLKNLIYEIKNYNIGGVCFFKGTPYGQATVTNTLQAISKTPLFISIDGEWGLGMRMDSVHSFPHQIVMGAMNNDSLVYLFGAEVARQCKCMGIHINFAPDIDVNSNPKNPVIGSRSFGEDKFNVAKKGWAYMKGMQDNGVIACAKHFPGHGETDNDSHYTLPVIKLSRQLIDSIHLYPFRTLIDSGVMSVMIAHLYIPAYDSAKNSVTSLSKPVITGLLKEKLGFNGLIISDALEMRGVTVNNFEGDIELKAFEAGNDILLLPADVPCAIETIKQAVDSGLICREDVDERCKKILRAKYWAGLSHYKPVNTEILKNCLNTKNAEDLNEKIFESAITLLKNKNDLVPLRRLDTLRIATLSIGFDTINDFQKEIGKYISTDHYYINNDKSPTSVKMMDSLFKNLSKYNLLIVNVEHTNELVRKNYGIKKCTIDVIDTLQSKIKIILDVFASPYSLTLFKTDHIPSVLISYDDEPAAEKASAKIIMGALPCIGRLPVSSNHKYPVYTGIQTTPLNRLKTIDPAQLKIDPFKLNKIDSVALMGIKAKAYPGCVILAAKDGKIFYQKSFGTLTYEDKTPVKNNDIYDLASLTKVLTTTISVMKLYDEGRINIDSTLGKYLPQLQKTDKGKLVIRDVMAHQSGLVSWIPFYKETLNDSSIYSKTKSDVFAIRVAEGMYMNKEYVNVMMQKIYDSKVQKKKKYLYSDLNFYLMKEIVETVTDKRLNEYVADNFYKPMGLETMGFNPRNRFTLDRIVPTELDSIFRKQLVHGDVHDPGAAMLGGVSGHAGLFSDAYDIAVIMQMILDKGEYAGNRYINATTVEEFTKVQFPKNDNWRGLGFDKPATMKGNVNTAKSASPASFGHSGFTGTFIWADPENKLLFVFLSNRVYPTADNNKLVKLNIRTDILQMLYEAVGGK